MPAFRFVGDCANIQNPNYNFRRFGQLEDMDDALAEASCLKGVQLIPSALWDQISPAFTDDELKKYPNAISQERAPAEFQAKKKAALTALHSYRESLKNPVPVQDPAPEVTHGDV